MPFISHGRIIGGLVTTPDLDLALGDYRDQMGLRLVSDETLSVELATSWGCEESAGARIATLQPQSDAHCFLRLVEQPLPDTFVPTTTYGWASYEMTVQDVFGWPARIAGGGFDVIGPPREIEGLPYFVAMQVHGRGKEMLYFNETRMNTPSTDLPFAQSAMDHIFIAILSAPDREAAVKWYCDQLKLDRADTYSIEYSMINEAFGLPAGTQSSLTMVQNGRMPILEIDAYPAQATARVRSPGCLPPGNAMVTLAVTSLDPRLAFLTPPIMRQDPIYAGRRVATLLGPAGELLELVEIG
jgi:catechol 2,3-dioxygenase-like lactoylglutathione lyase family enzyme